MWFLPDTVPNNPGFPDSQSQYGGQDLFDESQTLPADIDEDNELRNMVRNILVKDIPGEKMNESEAPEANTADDMDGINDDGVITIHNSGLRVRGWIFGAQDTNHGVDMRKKVDDGKGSDGKGQIQKPNDFAKINNIDGITPTEAECTATEAEFTPTEQQDIAPTNTHSHTHNQAMKKTRTQE